MDDKRLYQPFGLPRLVMVLLALPGLTLFVGVFGYAAYAGVTDVWPDIPTWIATLVAIFFPLLTLWGIGLCCALSEAPETAERMKTISRLASYAVLAAMIVWNLIKAIT